MVNVGGTRTCVHAHVGHPLYHSTADADTIYLVRCINYTTHNYVKSTVPLLRCVRDNKISFNMQ